MGFVGKHIHNMESTRMLSIESISGFSDSKLSAFSYLNVLSIQGCATSPNRSSAFVNY